MKIDILTSISRTAEPTFALDQARTIVAWNPAMERLLGYPADTVVGRAFDEALPALDQAGNAAACGCNTPADPVETFIFLARRKSGDLLQVACSRLRLQNGSSSVLLHQLRPTFSVPIVAPLAPGDGGAGVEATGNGAAGATLSLTKRETEVLRHLADGMSNLRIAQHLFISIATVRTHRQHVLSKLGAHNTRRAIAIARRCGIV